MSSLNDFVALLNKTNSTYFLNSGEVFNKKNILYYAFQKKERYQIFSIPKKGGGVRTIIAPCPFLKLIQKNINIIFSSILKPTESSHGFTSNRSIVTNASPHVSKNFVFNIDLENFFYTIKFRRIKNVLKLSPFNLVDDREEIGFIVANLCSYDGYLPQGAPSSPILSNIICTRLDKKINKLSIENSATYTRYADDITISAQQDIFSKKFQSQLNKIIQSEDFKINSKKTRLQSRHFRQEVTGIVVNEKLNLDRKYIREIRSILFNWEQKGLSYACQQYNSHNNTNKAISNFANIILGKIHFIKNVRGKNDSIYLKYYHKFISLTKPDHNEIDLVKNNTTSELIKSFVSEKSIKSDYASEEYLSLNINQEKINIDKLDKDAKRKQHNINLKHNPLSVVSFLNLFKINSPLKTLVHEEDNDYETLTQTIEEARALIEKHSKNLPFELLSSIWRIYYEYKYDGIFLAEKTNLHPLLIPSFKKKIQLLKRDYRLGYADTEETNLEKLISKVINEPKTRSENLGIKVVIEPNVSNASLLTDVQRIKNAIRHIIKNNYKYRDSLEMRFSLSVDNNSRLRTTNLFVTQPGQVAHIDPSTLLTRLINEEGDLSSKLINKINGYLYSRADWSIISNFQDSGAYELKILDYLYDTPKGELIYLDSPQIGFTHKITFYG